MYDFAGVIPLDYGQTGCADHVVLQEFDVGEPIIGLEFSVLHFGDVS